MKNTNTFYEKFRGKTNEEIIKAYKNRDGYQPEAARAIEQLAQERGITGEKLNEEEPDKEPFVEPAPEDWEKAEKEYEQIRKADEPDMSKVGVRPVTITIICIIGWVFLSLLLFPRLSFVIKNYSEEMAKALFYTQKGWFFLFYIVFSFIALITLFGLWKMKQWAAWVLIAVSVFLIVTVLKEGRYSHILLNGGFIGVALKYWYRFV